MVDKDLEKLEEYKGILWCMNCISKVVEAGIMEWPSVLSDEGKAAVPSIVEDYVPSTAMIDDILANMPRVNKVPPEAVETMTKYLYICRRISADELILEFQTRLIEDKLGRDD